MDTGKILEKIDKTFFDQLRPFSPIYRWEFQTKLLSCNWKYENVFSLQISSKLRSDSNFTELSVLKYFNELYTNSKWEISKPNNTRPDLFLISENEPEPNSFRTVVVKFLAPGVLTLGVKDARYNFTAINHLAKIFPDAAPRR